MIQRRGFLAGILAAGVAPAFVGSKILMPVKAIALPEEGVWIADHMADMWRYTTNTDRPDVIVTSVGMIEIIRQVLAEKRPEVIRNLEHNNTLYRQILKGRK